MQTIFRAAIGSCTFEAVPTPEGVIVLVWTDPRDHSGPEENEVSVAEAREIIAVLEAAVAAVATENTAAVIAETGPRKKCYGCREELHFRRGVTQPEGGKLFGFCQNCNCRNEITAAEHNEIHAGNNIPKLAEPNKTKLCPRCGCDIHSTRPRGHLCDCCNPGGLSSAGHWNEPTPVGPPLP